MQWGFPPIELNIETKIWLLHDRVDAITFGASGAIDSTARDFYLKYEFIPFHDQPLSLFLPIKTIIKEFSIDLPSPTNQTN
jgi:hypothetical protein